MKIIIKNPGKIKKVKVLEINELSCEFFNRENENIISFEMDNKLMEYKYERMIKPIEEQSIFNNIIDLIRSNSVMILTAENDFLKFIDFSFDTYGNGYNLSNLT